MLRPPASGGQVPGVCNRLPHHNQLKRFVIFMWFQLRYDAIGCRPSLFLRAMGDHNNA